MYGLFVQTKATNVYKRWPVDELTDEDGESMEMRKQLALELADRNITHQASTESTLDQEWSTLKECVSAAEDKVLGLPTHAKTIKTMDLRLHHEAHRSTARSQTR